MQMELQATRAGEEISQPLLNYVADQERWERGELWLVGVVGIAHLLFLLPNVCDGISMIHNWFPYLSLPVKWKFIWRMANFVLMSVASLAMAAGAMLALQQTARVGQAKRLLLVLALLAAATGVVGFFDDILLIIVPFRGIAFDKDLFYTILCYKVRNVTLWCYPLIMLAVLLGRSKSSLSRRLVPRAVWWLTAIAFMLFGATRLVQWFLYFNYFENMWMHIAQKVFAVITGQDWWNTIRGIGLISAEAASIGVYVIVLWTVLFGWRGGGRGRKGCRALMICAALWIVFAVGFYGTSFVENIHSFVANPWSKPRGGIWDIVGGLCGISSHLREMTLMLAFAMAGRAVMHFYASPIDAIRK
ncbi:MAG: hypothetical protein FWD61_19985 [Phycisphaerales bacterium]|nr:hypothetical protein [Phycisphaerales bacterium]